MSKYKLWHVKSSKWVEVLQVHWEGDDTYISTLEFVSDDEEEYAKVFDDSEKLNVPKKLEEQMGLKRVHLSDQAYKYFSPELDSWLSHINGGMVFEAWRDSRYEVYPTMRFRYTDSDGIIIRDEATIEWLRLKTGLEAVKVDE